jgi:H2-forming N5,N10-methylenetetrahydromethanopterin dehydrogenase-like enzyme
MISEGTRVPLRWFLILLGCNGTALALAMTVGIWVSKVEVKLEATEHQANRTENLVEKISDSLFTIDQRLSRIEGEMGILEKK